MDTQTTGTFYILIAGMVFLTLLLTMFMLSIFRQYRFRLLEYEQQLTREIELIDAERRRMHIDLHDEIGAGLASIGLMIQQNNFYSDENSHRKIHKKVKELRNKIREIAYNSIPSVLESNGLKMALSELLNDIRYDHHIEVESELLINDQKLHPVKSVHVYRIIKEMLTNSLQHSDCSKITCNIHQHKKMVVIKIADNGSSFSNKKADKLKTGSGLSHIQSRAQILKAQIKKIQDADTGTAYQILIPVESLIQ